MKYEFEAKTIHRVLVLSTFKWKMHPVTPLSFLDHIIRRLGLKSHLHWEFLKRCENLILSIYRWCCEDGGGVGMEDEGKRVRRAERYSHPSLVAIPHDSDNVTLKHK
ncbi:cyclin-D3-1 [Senna tora]|uniref:Cyclin-D3-1 n=1 Tax=Senna tora TaxID=362788 RepID=A0A834T128_9FABA|nr:cyclin-D3-1 [Senna tora]